MSWGAIILAALTLLGEIFKLIREVRADKKEARIELKKKKTEIIQSGVRGLIDGDDARFVAAVDKLRVLRIEGK